MPLPCTCLRSTPIEHEGYVNLSMDLEDLEALPDRLQDLMNNYPEVQGIVFCAGRGQFGSLEEFSYSQIRSLMDLNFLSQAYLAKAYLPLFKKRGDGDLIFIGSESALKGSRKGAAWISASLKG